MVTNLTKEIAAKAAMLPDDLQSEALQFVEALLAQKSNAGGNKQPLASVKGILQSNFETLDDDLSEKCRDLLKSLQTAKAKKGMKKAFNASPAELGRAAVKAERKKGQTRIQSAVAASLCRRTPKPHYPLKSENKSSLSQSRSQLISHFHKRTQEAKQVEFRRSEYRLKAGGLEL